MSALGQKQPLNNWEILTPERLLSGYTGHSPLLLLGDASDCFRPEAVIRVTVNLRRKRNPPCLTLFRQTSVGTVQQLNWIALYCIPFGSGLSGDYLV